MESESADLPPHIEGTVRAIAELHAEHHQRASSVERAIDRATAMLARPAYLGFVTVFVLLWIGVNVSLFLTGRTAVDPPPFGWLSGALSLMALYMTTLILVTQRRADQLASRREQMTLELSILSEQKNAKIIELLEELRRDSPDIRDRVDEEAAAMATPSDARAVLEAIADTHQEMIAEATEGCSGS